jgi:dihydroorotate dehydrogenase
MAHADRARVLYRILLRPFLFLLDAETAHSVAAFFLRIVHRVAWLRALLRRALPPALEVHALGQTFASPILLAAGFDKSAEMYNALGAIGFAGVEIGTVTAHAQPGNPRPRLFRLPADHAVVNRMGFNNPGAAAVEAALAAHPRDASLRLGVNLGKSKVTELDRAADDYAESARRLARFADYLVINVSSPNTPGLRSLQSVDALRPIVEAVQRELATLDAPPPLLVKIAPDLADEDIDAVVDYARDAKLAGIVATNTTISRDDLGLSSPRDRIDAIGAGGLSGRPLRRRALEVIRRVAARSRGSLTIIGVGGIETADDVFETLRAGAALVQVYTGFLYEGPGFARRLARGLLARMQARGVRSVAELATHSS